MTDPRLNKLRFRAWRRGFREADLILGGFADERLATLTPAQVDAFERLLDQEDHDVYAWIVGQEVAPTAFQGEVLEMIRAFHLNLPASRGENLGA
jgi:antitoxin CptB